VPLGAIYGIKAFVSRLRRKKKWWLDAGSNRGHTDFQSISLTPHTVPYTDIQA